MSATLTENVDIIKKLTMKKHVTLKLAESALPTKEKLEHFQCCLNEDFEKFLTTLAMLKERVYFFVEILPDIINPKKAKISPWENTTFCVWDKSRVQIEALFETIWRLSSHSKLRARCKI